MNHLRCRDFYAVGSALIDKNEKLHGFPVWNEAYIKEIIF